VIHEASAVHEVEKSSVTAARVGHLGAVVFCGVFPAIVVAMLFGTAANDDSVAEDFQQFYGAAVAILHGRTAYPDLGTVPEAVWGGPYPYPPLPALVTTPLTVLSLHAAGLVMMALLVATALAIPFVLGVRDWRCFGIALLWPPVLSAIQTGNLTLPLGLCAALAWRYRDRLVPASTAVGVTLAAKLFLWPLVVWLAATKRTASAVAALGVGVGLLIASWAVIGFDGFLGYPDRLQRLDRVVGEDSYTTYIVGLDAGLPSLASRLLWVAVGIGVLAAVVVVARRGDERSAFALALCAALALTPIVWLHYFALLLVIVSLMQPRLALAWFVPLAMVLTPGSGHPTPFQTAWTLAVAVATVALAIRGVDLGRWFRTEDRAAPAAEGR
jgi:glycosyl transferase family 87